jgi:hypothetical protein
MPLLGHAALAMWWKIHADHRDEFGDWHSHEHFPERVRIPGFRRGSRWTSTTNREGFFALYELDKYETLTSPEYLERLNHPTPWSTKMMPHHLNMVRSQCRVLVSYGGGIAGFIATVRLSPRQGLEEGLAEAARRVLGEYPKRPGLTGAHLLKTDTPKLDKHTREQQLRGADTTADWIIVVSGYDHSSLQGTVTNELSASALSAIGAELAIRWDFFSLAFSLTTADLAED